MGLANTLARVGSIMAPLVRMVGDVVPALPLVIYGAAPVLSGLVAAFLPETRDTALPETMQDLQRRWDGQTDRPGDTVGRERGAGGVWGWTDRWTEGWWDRGMDGRTVGWMWGFLCSFGSGRSREGTGGRGDRGDGDHGGDGGDEMMEMRWWR